MIIDASALVAILTREPEREPFLLQIASATEPRTSAASLLEAAIAVNRSLGAPGVGDLMAYVRAAQIEIMPFTEPQAHLNILDCVTYALARQTAEPLLFKGDDFPHTDLPLAP